MENAAKALTIAGAVLLAILVAAIAVYNYNKIKETAYVYSDYLDSVEIEKYNSVFSTYVGRTNVTAQEIISVAGAAKEKNVGTIVYVDGIDITNYTNDQQKQFLSKYPIKYERQENTYDMVAKNTFSFDGIEYSDTGIVIELKFKKNNV